MEGEGDAMKTKMSSVKKEDSPAAAPSAAQNSISGQEPFKLAPMTGADRSILSYLEEHGDVLRTRPAYAWCDERGRETERTYGDLWKLIRQVAYVLVKKLKVQKKGDRIVLLFEPGIEFIHIIFGCLAAGAAVVPLYPPNNAQRDIPRIVRVVQDCKPKVILVSSDVKLFLSTTRLKGIVSSKNSFDLPHDSIHEVPLKSSAKTMDPVKVDPKSVALLQYTSGSTGDPKGVIITHGNLQHNLAVMASTYNVTKDTIFVSWQPMYHDMGLIGGLILPLRQAFRRVVYISPVTFITNPSLYIRKLSEHKATYMMGPTFSYGLMARKWPANEKTDLSHLTWAAIAAERIVPETLDKFTKVFAPYGFRPICYAPLYGLAEHTVYVCDKPYGTPIKIFPNGRVSCGRAPFDVVLKIVDPYTCEEMRAGEEGEVWVDSPSKAAGYWGALERSVATFGASIKGDNSRTYLRTGDLGCLIDGELCISGRIKEIIIIRAKKYHAEDLEIAAYDSDVHQFLRPSCMAAVAVPGAGGEEELVIIAEVRDENTPRDQLEECARAAAAAVTASASIQVARLVLVATRALPKTSRLTFSSGKLQRLRSGQMLSKGELAGKILVDIHGTDSASETLSLSNSGKAGALATSGTGSGRNSPARSSPLSLSSSGKGSGRLGTSSSGMLNAPTWIVAQPEKNLFADMKTEGRIISTPDAAAEKFCQAAAQSLPLWQVKIDEVRRRFVALMTLQLPKLSVLSAANLFADGPNGSIPVRLYKPNGSIGKILPVTVFYHGGGWVSGSLDTHDHFCRDLCIRTGSAVASVEYRLAPEHKFPAPLNDCIAAVEWIHKIADRLSLDPGNIALCGESTGASLAAAVAVAIRDKGTILLAGQVLFYPFLDAFASSPAYASFPLFGMSRDTFYYYRESYLTKENFSNPLASVLYAKHQDLPPTHVILAECDPLIDEGTLFVQLLQKAEVESSTKVFAGQVHGFATLPMHFPEASDSALSDAAAALKRFFG